MTNTNSDMAKSQLCESQLDQIICGDSRQVLAELPSDSIDMLVTSPPYFRQRNYQHEQQIGQEKTAGEYVDQLVGVFREGRRLLKPSGTFWLVLGDKYQDGELLGMPWRVAHALKDDGWILRSEIIWHKPNAMPSAVKNRPTTDHETIFFFAKNKKYYYDADAIREPHVTFSEQSKMRGGRKHFFQRAGSPEQGKNAGDSNLHDGRWDQAFNPKGRNKRTVWSAPLSKFRQAHFAVFPEALVRICILAGCPPAGVVLDPFMGSGTTAVVARAENRRFIGADCTPEYCKMARQRLQDTAPT